MRDWLKEVAWYNFKKRILRGDIKLPDIGDLSIKPTRSISPHIQCIGRALREPTPKDPPVIIGWPVFIGWDEAENFDKKLDGPPITK